MPRTRRARRDNRADDEHALNLTPMIDVTFLLIIFFLVMTQITSQDDVDLCLPDALTVPANSEDHDRRFTVHIAPVNATHGDDLPGEFAWFCYGEPNPKSIDEMRAILEFEARVTDPRQGKPGTDPATGISENTVLVRCDARAPAAEFGKLVELMGAAKMYRLNIAFLKDQRVP